MMGSGAMKLPSAALDDIDYRILRELQDHGRLPNVELADLIDLSPAPCLRRLRSLEKSGIIRSYVALVDAKSVGLAITVFVEIRVDLQFKGRFEDFEESVRRRPEVLECYLMTGDADYLLRVVVPDVDAYERFLREWLRRVEGITEIKSSFGLKQVKYSTALPIESNRVIDGRHLRQPEHAKRRRQRRPRV